jgi:DNA-binding NarL/FixJ family response regulator
MDPRRPASTAPKREMIRIVLVESSALVGLGIRDVLDGEPDMEVVAEVRSADDALAVAEDRAPDVFLLDVELQEPSTSAATRQLVQESPGSEIVVVGGQDDDASILEAIDIGAKGHVASVVKPAELVAVIRKVAEGEDPLKDEVIGRPDLIDRIMDGFRESFRRADESPTNPLTPRELDVLGHVARGMRNRQVAEALDIGEQTVKNHLQSVMHKLGVSNRVRAVTTAIREGWLTLDEDGADAAAEAHGEERSLATTESTRQA